jgi:hypothetical protein
MEFFQVRINYTDNSACFYRRVVGQLQCMFDQTRFARWTIARGWQNGPHYLLTIDCGSPLFRDEWRSAIGTCIDDFLARFPSVPCDPVKQRALQEKLNQLESAGIDPAIIEENNTWTMWPAYLAVLARKYESPAQWLSVFDTETGLRDMVTARWLESDQHEDFAGKMMILLACVFPPVPSDDPVRPEYNGFLSYYSNFLFWHHSLKPVQQEQISERFNAAYAQSLAEYQDWMRELETDLARPAAFNTRVAAFLVRRFGDFGQLVQQELIHARSPFPQQRLANKETVSGFHQQFFYNADGSAYQFSADFAAYRWLLNIIYKIFPLLNIAPLTRQKLNHALDRLHAEHGSEIARIRCAMMALTESEPIGDL